MYYISTKMGLNVFTLNLRLILDGCASTAKVAGATEIPLHTHTRTRSRSQVQQW